MSINLEHINLVENNNQNEYFSILESETLVGWSTACLDQTISYYLDCSANEVSICDSITRQDS